MRQENRNVFSCMVALVIFFCMISAKAFAYDIAVENADGITIYYNYIHNGEELEVTFCECSYNNTYAYYGTIVIPEEVIYNNTTRKVTSIGMYAFNECRALTSVDIPNSVTSLGECAFYSCSRLKSIQFPENITTISNSTFYRCYDLTSVTIPNKVTTISKMAFYDCMGLKTVTIPSSVTSIGEDAFGCCQFLTAVHISDVGAWCNIKFSNFESNPLYFAHHLFLNNEEIKDLVIPDNVTSIGNQAFYACHYLTSVTIPNNVTSIGDLAFKDCSNLTSVNFSNSITSIGKEAFYDCCRLTSLSFPNSVTSIGRLAFAGCKSLESITFPNTITTIEEGSFSRCTSLVNIIFPNSVEIIKEHAFSQCWALTCITIGNGIKEISQYAFGAYPDLRDVYCYAEEVPQTDLYAFSYFDMYDALSKIVLHIPSSSVDKYKSVEPWKYFKFPDQTSIEEPQLNHPMNERFYNLSGRKISNFDKGLYIIGGKKVIIK